MNLFGRRPHDPEIYTKVLGTACDLSAEITTFLWPQKGMPEGEGAGSNVAVSATRWHNSLPVVALFKLPSCCIPGALSDHLSTITAAGWSRCQSRMAWRKWESLRRYPFLNLQHICLSVCLSVNQSSPQSWTQFSFIIALRRVDHAQA